MMRHILLVSAALLSCGESQNSPAEPTPEPSGTAAFGLADIASGLSRPVYLTAPTGDARLFVVEKVGRIRVIKNGSLLSTPFLDITSKVGSGGNEQGLLSVAFHPSYASNGFMYVNYTDVSGDTRIERYTVSSNPDVANPVSAKLILAIDQPFSNHNGGLNLFGPDGMLYIGMGDGGSGGDPNGNGQNKNALLGKILRIDVDRGDPYAIPVTNPFANGGGRAEVWAYGLRNPWRFTFDKTASLLYIADVGQNSFEEVNVVPASTPGVNYGWNIMEGASCYNAPSCNQSGLQQPVITYKLYEAGTCTVIGGLVYRGSAVPQLVGHYLYADYCAGWIRSFTWTNNSAANSTEWQTPQHGNITSFGQDGSGEAYILSENGHVYKIVKQ